LGYEDVQNNYANSYAKKKNEKKKIKKKNPTTTMHSPEAK
jgi:hypothetical protein